MTLDHSDAEIAALLSSLDPEDPAVMSRLHDRLATAAAGEHTLDIAYRTVDSPLGPLLLAATERGMVRVAFAAEDHDAVLQRLAEKLSPRILRSAARLDPAARELDEYFAGKRRLFDLPLDLSLSRGFRLSVLQHLPHIAYGRTESYAEVALATGSPRAVRAVGTACATNPLPVIVPCHRVVKSDGSLGNYLGGIDAKRTLLELEAA
ncbi:MULTISPECIES: methylated-DNA--[protein]-cysteine S-methyltransferase [Arthrobacter]|uniref:Methylated-DNA--protein-cysteine methyltransferase n=1 Tax=Arthrobacter terricola TaxID=2547396 RepID=A0A4R5KQW0_9MICC|nr:MULTISPECIES: methylated-DNA--[protein]-cysteine S-methyltransferase [Arthrobacter]MBT8160856.1 methylated-DNA--[protein]-cysteine S-methyltransferase [Arthrobacter sp. GN70]TDF97385.1 methylated-DNA--[protein]-cysteine S-methyltransferase [Arthrobacter terricola]